jgi:hypothetical protein
MGNGVSVGYWDEGEREVFGIHPKEVSWTLEGNMTEMLHIYHFLR